MHSPTRRLSHSLDVSSKVARMLQSRTKVALQHLTGRVRGACEGQAAGAAAAPLLPWNAWASAAQYGVDFAQRSIHLLGHAAPARQQLHRARAAGTAARAALRARDGDGRALGSSGRSTTRCCASCRRPGVQVDARRRPYVIIDPRGGHGPGIGGFKDDSEVGVALRAGHPVYFVVFFRDPEPGQTLLDVCNAEREFVRRVRELHPDAPKPAIVGNCQGGWPR